MNNHEEYNDCKSQLEQIHKIKVNRMVRLWRKILKILSKPRKKAVLFKAKFKLLLVMTKKQMMKQKLIIMFSLFSIICIKKHYPFLGRI